MSGPAKVYVAATGMVTPLGADTATTAAAVKAGISAYQDSDFFANKYERVRMALVPDEILETALDAKMKLYGLSDRQARLLKFLALSISQIQPYIPKDIKVPIFIAGPESTEKSQTAINKDFVEYVAQVTGDVLDLPMSRVVSSGRAGSLLAIRMAFRYFESGHAPYVIIAGVDTSYDPKVLKKLISENRLLLEENSDGFVPGEGAGVLLLCKTPVSLNLEKKKHVVLFEPGVGNETGHRYSDIPYRGDGLSLGLAEALSYAQIQPIKTIISSMNGENIFAKEHGVAVIRNSDSFYEKCAIKHPADCFGDLGAAYGSVAIGIVAENTSVTDYPSPCVITSSSDREQRAAIVMQTL